MQIIIELDDTLTVGASIEGVTQPNQDQCVALRDLAILAGHHRQALLGTPPKGVDEDILKLVRMVNDQTMTAAEAADRLLGIDT